MNESCPGQRPRFRDYNRPSGGRTKGSGKDVGEIVTFVLIFGRSLNCSFMNRRNEPDSIHRFMRLQ